MLIQQQMGLQAVDTMTSLMRVSQLEQSDADSAGIYKYNCGLCFFRSIHWFGKIKDAGRGWMGFDQTGI